MDPQQYRAAREERERIAHEKGAQVFAVGARLEQEAMARSLLGQLIPKDPPAENTPTP